LTTNGAFSVTHAEHLLKARHRPALPGQIRKRPGAAAEVDSRKRAIVAAVRLAELREQIGKTQTAS
jgi:hypothetical protein